MANLPLWKPQKHKVSLAFLIHSSLSKAHTDQAVKQNAAKQPLIIRRPSRIIAQPAGGGGGGTRLHTAPPTGRPSMPAQLPSNNASEMDFSDSEQGHTAPPAGPGSYGFSSALSKQVLLRVRVTAGADVHFTTTISV